MTELPSNLIDDLRAGKDDAYQKLYELYADRIYILAFGVLQNEADAQDVVQRTFFSVYRKLFLLKNDKCFQKWLMKIASNESLMLLRHRKPEDLYGDESEDELSDVFQGEVMLPEVAAERSEEAEKLRAIIARLPEVQRRTLILYYYHEMKIREIAEVMECSEGTVKTRLRNARIRVKSEWEKQEGERKHYGVMLPFGDVFVRLLKQREPQKRRRSALWKRIRRRLGEPDDFYLPTRRSNNVAARIGAYVAVGVVTVMLASATLAGAAEEFEEPSGGFNGKTQQNNIAETQPERTVYKANEDIVQRRIGTGGNGGGDMIYSYEEYYPLVQQVIEGIPEEIDATQPTESPTEPPIEPPTELPTEAPTQAPAEAPTQSPREQMLAEMSGSFRIVHERYANTAAVSGGSLTVNDSGREVTFESLPFNNLEQVADGVYRFELAQQERYDGMFSLWSGYYYRQGTSVSYLPQELNELFRSLGYWRYEIRYSVDDYRMQKDVLLLLDPQNTSYYQYYYRSE